MSVLDVEGTFNVRDLGGIPTDSGRIRSGALLRSGSLARVSEAGAAVLRERVSHIVDLRGDAELQTDPSAVPGVRTTHLPLFFGSVQSFFDNDISLASMYDLILQEGGEKIAQAMRVIGAGEPTLVHCTVGKDRTGVTVALALSAVGADRDAVVADYALTESQLPQGLTQMAITHLQRQHPEATNLVDLASKSPAPVMRALLAKLDADYGSPADYLRAQGLTAGELGDLRAVLVES